VLVSRVRLDVYGYFLVWGQCGYQTLEFDGIIDVNRSKVANL